MEKVEYQNSYREKGHECENLVIRCMDFRFHKQLPGLLSEIFEEEVLEYDSPGVGGGGSKAVIDANSREVLFGAIDIAVEKHKTKRIIVVDHIDCGAYGGSGEHENPEAEEKFHAEKLGQAKEILNNKYPELEIVTLYQDWDSIKSI